MKKVLFGLSLILLSLSSLSQVKAKDSLPPVIIDTVVLFTVKDIEPIFEAIKKLPYDQAAPIIAYMQQLVQARVTEFNTKKSQTKEKPKK